MIRVGVDASRFAPTDLLPELCKIVHGAVQAHTTHVALLVENVPPPWRGCMNTLDAGVGLDASVRHPSLTCRVFTKDVDVSAWMKSQTPSRSVPLLYDADNRTFVRPTVPVRRVVLTAAWPPTWNAARRQTFLRLLHRIAAPTRVAFHADAVSAPADVGSPALVVSHRLRDGQITRTLLGTSIAETSAAPRGRHVLVLVLDFSPGARVSVQTTMRARTVVWPVTQPPRAHHDDTALTSVLGSLPPATSDLALRACADWLGMQ